MTKVVEINDSDFTREVVEAKGKVVVKFWAEWCGPCKVLEKTYQGCSQEFPNVKFVAVDIDKNQRTPPIWGIRALPSILVFEDGKVVNQAVGAMTQAQLSNVVQGL